MARTSWRLLAWLDARANRLHGWKANPLYQSGSLAIAMLAVMVVTGVYLLFFYRLRAPWGSIAALQAQAWTGRWIRAAHRYAADIALVAAGVHVFRMYAERRTWGPRVLAWLSGALLMGLLLVCGWTGYVMVWDVQGRLLAYEGARILDVLPLFSEPLARAFSGEVGMPSAFFFLNLFAHVALPVGFLLLLWIHVSRLARPTLFPPRRLLMGLFGLLLALSLVVPAPLGLEGDAFRMPQRAPLDLFYAFWLPIAERIHAGWTLLVFATGLLVLVLVPWLTRPSRERRPETSRVDSRLCTGCEQCYQDCPYEAIRMVSRTDGRPTLVAQVDQALCVSCGICAGSCAPMGVGPPGRTGRDQLDEVREFVHRNRPIATDVAIVGCAQSGLATAGVDAPVLRVGCAGNLHTSVVEFIVRSGAGGVLVVACPGRDCWNREGPEWLKQRMYEEREAELKDRVDRARVRMIHAAWAEPRRVRDELDRLRVDISRLGPRRAETVVEVDTECVRDEVEA